MFEMPIIVLFFRENGLSMQDVFVLQALFSLVTIVLDVPTGHFSDMFSRKVSIVIGEAFLRLVSRFISYLPDFGSFLLRKPCLALV